MLILCHGCTWVHMYQIKGIGNDRQDVWLLISNTQKNIHEWSIEVWKMNLTFLLPYIFPMIFNVICIWSWNYKKIILSMLGEGSWQCLYFHEVGTKLKIKIEIINHILSNIQLDLKCWALNKVLILVFFWIIDQQGIKHWGNLSICDESFTKETSFECWCQEMRFQLCHVYYLWIIEGFDIKGCK
jgi:hypothetical protein